MTNILKESLDWHDMKGQVEPRVTVDEYAAKMGKDKDVVTLSFIVNSEQAGNDIVNWFERGYNWILDASLSAGEIEIGKYIVFVELSRRSTAPRRIIELITDLKTLTDLSVEEWTVVYQEEEYEADANALFEVMILNPNLYKAEEEMQEEELNEVRQRAGLEHKPVYDSKTRDSLLKEYLAKAGL